MEKVMAALPLSDNIKSALVHGNGELIGYLRLVESYEKGQWDQVADIAQALEIDQQHLPERYLAACQWSNTFNRIDE
jgi:EAL and modified HD-GYP domain-containing signal transduction protein